MERGQKIENAPPKRKINANDEIIRFFGENDVTI